ncbi:glycosyltransferase family 1 protein [Phellopilus nigrolimitatus]|nr:glycosyltransferase family 1 protein [Phellopilus nigrolimitatus]
MQESKPSSSSSKARNEGHKIRLNPDIDYKDYAQYAITGKGLASAAHLDDDGRISISLDLKRVLPDLPEDYARDVLESATDSINFRSPPCMNIVIMIVGSRGDVQPFLALGKKLLKDGHRVRIATHNTFRSFVTENGLEFFNIGGDPEDLMSYMVKNPGLVPGLESLTNGDIKRKRTMLIEMLEGCWNACSEADPETGRTFAADSIISNPPAFAHVHCAEALGIPLSLSFTMPWCATTDFPHPLVNVKQTNAKKGLTNYLTYALTDHMTWQGLGDIIDEFREKSLGLQALSVRHGPGILDKLKIPWTYCMSPALVPKPKDWKNHIDLVGFYFLDLSTNYTPPADLAAFLAAGPPPIYIGFGSIVIDDPQALTSIIFQAVARAGVRALVSAGWGGLGSGTVPENIFILGNVPHDWLFDKVSAVCHHGGAGTTAIGLSMGKPTIVVPFFGDQPFWGNMIYKSGAGPEPIRQKKLNAENLTAAIQYVLKPSAQAAAHRLASQIQAEDGTTNGALSFYRHLPLLNMRCDLESNRTAVWWSTDHCLRLSAFAAQTLADERLIDLDSLDPHRPREFDPKSKVTDPISGGAAAIFWTVTNYYSGIAQIFYKPVKGVIKTTTAIPRGVMNIILSIHEGLHNMPQLYGSDIRERDTVDGFASGVKTAGKGLYYGYYDGITGLVREPLEGAKKEGFVGFVKGAGRSFVNATVRPAAGIVGVVAHPLYGVWTSAAKHFTKRPIQIQRATRISDGLQDVQNSTEAQRLHVLAAFKKARESERKRKEDYKQAAKKVLVEAQEEEVSRAREETLAATPGPLEAATSSTPGSPSAARPPAYSDSTSGSPTASVPASNPRLGEVDEANAQFLADLEKATQLSFRPSSIGASSTGSPTSTRVDDLSVEDQEFLRDLEKAKELSLQ